MQSIKSLKQLIDEKVAAFYVTEASPELIKEIQSILGITATGIVDDRTKVALGKFKSERNLPYLASLGVQTAQALLESANKPNYLLLTKTNKKDQYGCFVLLLQYFKNGQVVDELPMRSGQARCQNFRKGIDSKSGSFEPLPEGRWKIEQIFWAGGKDNWNASHGDGIGPVSVPLTYDSPEKTDRSAIVIHWDENALEGKPGSAGCPVTYTLEAMKKVIGWLRDSDPKYFYVDWNLGTCPAVSFPKPEPHSSTLPPCGVELIKKFEGCFLNAYPDPLTKREPITIGWGSTRKRDGSPWRLGESISQQEADALLILQVERDYLPDLAKIPCWGELNPNQRGALLSFGYNLGSKFYGAPNFTSITTVLQNRDWSKIRETFIKYRNPGTNVEQGLRRRREAEADLFLTPY
ncbi:glycoside hydrolase family protein [Scytonema hofmannii]|uniref:glycoside hydrolase family protein n=1 Tax=Scytonema hofmannii TaxID=34078 RepID=UPI000347D10F|nr:glycoside hydrolase family protein [Scytonema hofmannii]